VYPPQVVVTRAGVKNRDHRLHDAGVMVWDRSRLGGRIRVRDPAEPRPLALRVWISPASISKVVLIHSGLNEPSSYDTAGVGAENAALGSPASLPAPDRTW